MSTERIHGHFGELLQGRLGERGPVVLVTLPFPRPVVEVSRAVSNRDSPLLRRAGEVFASRFPGRQPSLRAQLFYPQGGGAGCSTAEALGAIRILARERGISLSAEHESAMLLEVEGAVDPLAFPASPPLLWASREARVIETLPPLPYMRAIGGFDGGGTRTDPSDEQFPDISALLLRLKDALSRRDLRAIGAVASASTRLNAARNPKPRAAQIEALAKDSGALGIAVAHTGSASALLYAPSQIVPPISQLEQLGLTHCVAFEVGEGAASLASAPPSS